MKNNCSWVLLSICPAILLSSCEKERPAYSRGSGSDRAYSVTESVRYMTTSEKAVEDAKRYLKVTAFSRDRLVDQLEYEGYSEYDAEYGADHCGADWSEQAELSAKAYLKHSAFSYDGLVEQLEYEKFSHTDSDNAVRNCGADWNEQAVKAAKKYAKYSDFSRSRMIEQLEYEGFTHSQAVYGADHY